MKRFGLIFMLLGGVGLGSLNAFAEVASTPHFVAPGEIALGFEPELTLTNGAGLGFNARYTQGLTDLNNMTLIVGTGSGPRRFRIGGNVSFDFFPDTAGQPGLGVAFQGIYWRLKDSGRLDVAAMPYIHKTIDTPGGQIEPYFSFPFGLGFGNGSYQPVSSVVLGSMFKATSQLRYLVELGINVNHSESYVSGGIVYYP